MKAFIIINIIINATLLNRCFLLFSKLICLSCKVNFASTSKMHYASKEIFFQHNLRHIVENIKLSVFRQSKLNMWKNCLHPSILSRKYSWRGIFKHENFLWIYWPTLFTHKLSWAAASTKLMNWNWQNALQRFQEMLLMQVMQLKA